MGCDSPVANTPQCASTPPIAAVTVTDGCTAVARWLSSETCTVGQQTLLMAGDLFTLHGVGHVFLHPTVGVSAALVRLGLGIRAAFLLLPSPPSRAFDEVFEE